MDIKVGERQKRRKISQLKHYASVALTCMEPFGLNVTMLEGVTDAGEATTLQLDPPLPSSSMAAASGEMMELARHTLYLLYRFRVSDEFYYELAQVRIEYLQPYIHMYLHVPIHLHMYMFKSVIETRQSKATTPENSFFSKRKEELP